MSTAKKITDHDQIKRWAEDRGGVPAVVIATEAGENAGLLRFDFDGRDDSLREIDWDTFFEAFDSNDLALLAQDEIDGSISRFFKFVER